MSTSMFACIAPRYKSRGGENVCEFAELSQCSAKRAENICNHHLSIFGLQTGTTHVTDGINNTFIRDVVYASSVENVSIPLFVNTDGMIMLPEIRNFAKNIKHKNANIDDNKLADILAKLVGMTAYEDLCKMHTWLENAEILVYDPDREQVDKLSSLPRLHKILFQDTCPSIVLHDNGTVKCEIDNLRLIKCPTTGQLRFELANKELIGKKTNHPSCVATPLVLAAQYKMTTVAQEQSFKTIKPQHLNC